MFSCLEKLIVTNVRGYDEFSLTDALECMMQQGAKFKSFKVQNWYDCGKKETLLESNATLLKKFGGNNFQLIYLSIIFFGGCSDNDLPQ